MSIHPRPCAKQIRVCSWSAQIECVWPSSGQVQLHSTRALDRSVSHGYPPLVHFHSDVAHKSRAYLLRIDQLFCLLSQSQYIVTLNDPNLLLQIKDSVSLKGAITAPVACYWQTHFLTTSFSQWSTQVSNTHSNDTYITYLFSKPTFRFHVFKFSTLSQ
jgi:hypothetical protein